jgi:4-hydroxy-4-methyl-2-oxoglutarate aldolase
MTLDQRLLEEAAALGSATLHEAADRTGALPAALRPVACGMRVAGPAFTVRCPPGDNLWIHRAIYAARPGDVLVVATGNEVALWGSWGEIMTVAAQSVGLAGLVLQGGSRDHDALAEVGFPVVSLGPCIRGTGKDETLDGRLGEVIDLGDVTVHPGDLIVGDNDGVLAVRQNEIGEVISRGHERVDNERKVIAALRQGATTLELYNLR